jgi:hypothetical protein
MSEKRELSRAEQVRLRRKQQAQKRPNQPVQKVARTLPSVTSRSFVAPKRAVTANTRRRYQAAFSMPGVHVKMPSVSLPHFEVGARLASFLLSLLLGVLIYFAWTLPTFRVVAANVNGNQRLSAEEINAVLSSAGQPVFTLMPSDLETRLRLNYPELASAKVSVSLPNILSVSVTERQPVILWQQNGGYTWIDNSGVAFRPRGSAGNLISVTALAAPAPGLPSMNDPLSPVPFMSLDMVKAIQTLAPSLPSGTSMVYDAQYGLGWTDSRGWQVFFGTASKDMALKLQVYQSLVISLASRGITPAFISVQYANAPFYRMSK